MFKTILGADFPMYRCFLAIFDCLSDFTYLRVFAEDESRYARALWLWKDLPKQGRLSGNRNGLIENGSFGSFPLQRLQCKGHEKLKLYTA